MPRVYESKYCHYCQRMTLHSREGVNHLLHLILTILTSGLWLLVWIALIVMSKFRPWYCEVCKSPYAKPRRELTYVDAKYEH